LWGRETVQTGYTQADISRVCFGFVFSSSFIFKNMAGFVFGFVFPQLRIFNNFPALFLGLFGFVFRADPLFSVTSRLCFLK